MFHTASVSWKKVCALSCKTQVLLSSGVATNQNTGVPTKNRERGLGMRGANCSLPDPNQTIVQEGDQEGNGGGRGGT